MAINGSRNAHPSASLLDARATRLAGIVSMVLALLGIAAVAACAAVAEGLSEAMKAMAAGKIVLLAIVAAAGTKLITGRIWAQRFLLVIWLGGLVTVATAAVGIMLWHVASLW